MNKIDMHRNLCDMVHDTYKRKNHDYGDSFSKTREIVPSAILVRLHDKLNRLDVLLTKGDQKVKDESIEDTLLDLANYALMEIVERKNDSMIDNVKAAGGVPICHVNF